MIWLKLSIRTDCKEGRSLHIFHQFKTFSSPIIQITARALARKLLSSRGYKTFPCRPLGGPFFTIFFPSLIVLSLETSLNSINKCVKKGIASLKYVYIYMIISDSILIDVKIIFIYNREHEIRICILNNNYV